MAGIDNVLKYLLELDASGVVNGSKAAGDAIQAFFDKVNTRITVLGMDNTITYKDGDPKVDKIGQSNTINKGS